jgi:hypothetical protein
MNSKMKNNPNTPNPTLRSIKNSYRKFIGSVNCTKEKVKRSEIVSSRLLSIILAKKPKRTMQKFRIQNKVNFPSTKIIKKDINFPITFWSKNKSHSVLKAPQSKKNNQKKKNWRILKKK